MPKHTSNILKGVTWERQGPAKRKGMLVLLMGVVLTLPLAVGCSYLSEPNQQQGQFQESDEETRTWCPDRDLKVPCRMGKDGKLYRY